MSDSGAQRPVLRTGHVGLNVTNLERSTAFYRTVFGFEVVDQSTEAGRRFAFLGDGRTVVLTLWEQSDGRFDAARPGLHHLSFQAPTVEEVREAEARLRALGARFRYDGIVAHREGASSGGIFFEDPDGTRLEIYAPAGVAAEAPVAGSPTCGFF
ncbi:MAG TPA: VOC family protein [Thermodesulfobacteriota bacterium]